MASLTAPGFRFGFEYFTRSIRRLDVFERKLKPKRGR
jgi:hypothetical protein